MKASGNFLKIALKCVTQGVLLPGVQLHFDDVLLYSKNIGLIIGKRKRFK